MKTSIHLIFVLLFSIATSPVWGAGHELSNSAEAHLAFAQRVLRVYPKVSELFGTPSIDRRILSAIIKSRGSRIVATEKHQLVGGLIKVYFDPLDAEFDVLDVYFGTVIHSPEVTWVGLFIKRGEDRYAPMGRAILSNYLLPNGTGEKGSEFGIAQFNAEQNRIEITSGCFNEGQLQGKGSITYPDSHADTGTWGDIGGGESGLVGEGSIIHSDGLIDTGTWGYDEEGEWGLVGRGSIHSDGSVDTGTWGYDEEGEWGLVGRGTRTLLSGYIAKGTWGTCDGKRVLTGRGSFTSPAGVVSPGIWGKKSEGAPWTLKALVDSSSSESSPAKRARVEAGPAD